MAATTISETVSTVHIDFDRKELKSALRSLCLTWAPVGDYLVIMNGEVDSNICGEPYLAMQLWLDLKTGKYISRLWNQTIATGKVVSVAQFLLVCKDFQGKPCTGCPVDFPNVNQNDHVIVYASVPRRISKKCHKFLRKIDSWNETCSECATLKDFSVKEEVVENKNSILERKHEGVMTTASICAPDSKIDLPDHVLCRGMSETESLDKISEVTFGATDIKDDLSDNELCNDLIEKEALNTISELNESYESEAFLKKVVQTRVPKKCKWCSKEFTKKGLTYYNHVRMKHFWGVFVCPKCKKGSYIFI